MFWLSFSLIRRCRKLFVKVDRMLLLDLPIAPQVLLRHGRAVLPEELRQLGVAELRAGEVHPLDGCLDGRYHAEALAGVIIPDAEGFVAGAADAEPVRRDGDAVDRTRVPTEYAEAFAGV